jgi:UDP:flavonoid glycosyltransferase YjiC (YdhE family)
VRVAVLAMGSRGDVEPFLALAAGLRRRGHTVVVATHAEFAALVTGAGVEFAELGGNPREALSSPQGQRMLATRNPLLLSARIGALVGPALDAALPAAQAACTGADVVVYATLAQFGLTVADQLGVPAVAAHLQPATPTTAMPAASLPSLRPPPAALNKASWLLSEALTWRAFRPTLNRQRARVGLPGLPRRLPSRWPRGRRPPVLYGFSPSVVPVPPDWPDDVHVTGYWFRDPDPAWSPPPALTAFLAAGPAPVYLGFGSMPDADPAGLVGALVGGARRAEHRMVLHSGWSKLREAGRAGLVGDDVLVVDDVPHAWLFPRMAAVVHHGGAGTTAAALRAGVPAVVIPLFADQFFWGCRVAALAAGAPPIPRERLTDARLAEALTDALRRRHGARRMAQALAAEDGVGAAVDLLETVS